MQKKRIITRQTVEHVAQVARLDLTEKELAKIEKDLNSILNAFKDLEKAPVKKEEPSLHPMPVADVFRDDIQEEGFTPEQTLGNTVHKERGFFKGPKSV